MAYKEKRKARIYSGNDKNYKPVSQIKLHSKKDLRSHRVPKRVYEGTKSMDVCSIKLCRILSQLYNWDIERSYRVPGVIVPEKKIIAFALGMAEQITKNNYPRA